MFGHLCHRHMLSSHRPNLITFLRAYLMIFHQPSLSHLQLESKTPNKSLQATAMRLSVLTVTARLNIIIASEARPPWLRLSSGR